MNEHEAQRIAAAIRELRPDWPASSLLTLMRKNLMDKPRRDVCVAFAWIAAEPATSNPGRVLTPGPWWKAAGIEGASVTRDGLRVHEVCGICMKPESDCRRIWSADHAFELNTRPDEPPVDVPTVVQTLKQDMACEEPRVPIERTHKPSPEVEHMRVLAAAGTTEEST